MTITQEQMATLLTVKQVADRMDRSKQLISLYIQSGDLPAISTPLGYFIRPEDFEAFMQKREAKNAT